MIRFFIIVSVFGISFSSHLDRDYIIFHSDAIGHYDMYLNKINPYKQSIVSVGAVDMESLINNRPMAHMIPNLDFIGEKDSSKIVSQFSYNRGDYAYRETDVLVKNAITSNDNLLFNLHGRKNPTYYELDYLNLDEYVLQNLLIDYTKDLSGGNKAGFFRITKHYSKENSQSEIFYEANNLGFEYNVSTHLHSLYFNWTNLMYSECYELTNTHSDFELIKFDFEYAYKKHKKIRPFFHFGYEYLSTSSQFLIEDFMRTSNSLADFQLGVYSEFSLFNAKQKIELALRSESSGESHLNTEFVFDSKFFYRSWMLRLKQFFHHDNMYGEYLHEQINEFPVNAFRLYKQNYFLTQARWSYGDLNFSLSDYNVHIKEDVLDNGENRFDKSGDFMEVQVDYNKGKINFVNHDIDKDVLEVSFNALYYSDYSPIKKYRTLDVDFTFKRPIESLFDIDINVYIPYMGLSMSKLKFNQSYGINMNSGTFVETNSINQIDYTLFDYEIGLMFKNFTISYKFINNSFTGQSGYSFPSETTDILNAIYGMKYLSVIWKFDN